jgi:lipopolysaccharide export system protein LptC
MIPAVSSNVSTWRRLVRRRGRLARVLAPALPAISIALSHAKGDDRHISLKKPLANITISSGAYVALAANESILDRDASAVSSSGDVTLSHDTGLSFQADSATIDLMAKTAGGNGDGELIAQGFRVLDDGDTMEFTGKDYMKIYPKQKNQEGQGG